VQGSDKLSLTRAMPEIEHQPRTQHPAGLALSVILFHFLNLITAIFIRWGEPDSLILAIWIGL
jgi:hypothetical protein